MYPEHSPALDTVKAISNALFQSCSALMSDAGRTSICPFKYVSGFSVYMVLFPDVQGRALCLTGMGQGNYPFANRMLKREYTVSSDNTVAAHERRWRCDRESWQTVCVKQLPAFLIIGCFLLSGSTGRRSTEKYPLRWQKKATVQSCWELLSVCLPPSCV